MSKDRQKRYRQRQKFLKLKKNVVFQRFYAALAEVDEIVPYNELKMDDILQHVLDRNGSEQTLVFVAGLLPWAELRATLWKKNGTLVGEGGYYSKAHDCTFGWPSSEKTAG